MTSFKDQYVLITGASAGIGKGFAEALHQQGAFLILVARRKDLLNSLAETFNKKRPQSVVIIECDLTSKDGIHHVTEYIQSHRVDIFINNAGRGSFGFFESIPLEQELQMVSLNVEASLILCHAVIPQMKARRSGAILILSSVAGYQAMPYMATYAATKAFNLNYALGLRYELRPFGVRVMAICPGPVETEFFDTAGMTERVQRGGRDSIDLVVQRSLRAIQSDQGIVVPGIRAATMVWLTKLLPKSLTTYITGKILSPKK